LVERRLSVRPADVVLIKAILDGCEGLGCLFSEGGGQLLLVSPSSRATELDALITDLAAELTLVVESSGAAVDEAPPADRERG
jgi:hypothetical protein